MHFDINEVIGDDDSMDFSALDSFYEQLGIASYTVQEIKKDKILQMNNMIWSETQPQTTGDAYNTISELHGNGNCCCGSLEYFQFDKIAFLFEGMDLYTRAADSELVKEIGEKQEDGEWLVSCKDSLYLSSYNSLDEDYKNFEHLANIIVNAPNDKEYCIYTPKSWLCKTNDDNLLTFRGVYKLDKVKSLYYRRIVLHRCSEIYWLNVDNQA